MIGFSKLDLYQIQYLASYNNNKDICVDESMLKFKGYLFVEQYLPSKPGAKWGIKVWSLCDSRTGFLWMFDKYKGKDISQILEGGMGYMAVSYLLNGFENKDHVVYIANFYSSAEVYDSFRVKQIGACGTERADRSNYEKLQNEM